jgi:ComF family protein
VTDRTAGKHRLRGGLVGVLTELVAPTRCVVCEATGTLLCDRCAARLVSIDTAQACPCCAAPFGATVCTDCQSAEGPREFGFEGARARFVFDEVGARLVKAFKDEGERRLAEPLAAYLLEAAGAWALSADLVVPVPATDAALRRRGFDHMALVAAAFSQMSGVPLRACLTKSKAFDQRGLDRDERRENMATGFGVVSAREAALLRVRSPCVLLLDDVFTTGSTLEAAAATLKAAGAREVYAVVLCRVW